MSDESSGPFTAHVCDESLHYRDQASDLRRLVGSLERTMEELAADRDRLAAKLADAERQAKTARKSADAWMKDAHEWRVQAQTVKQELNTALRERDEARAECERIKALLNTPRTDDFFDSVRTEAAHQIERWGVEHDAGKEPHDWFWLLGYLAGKALAKPEKRLHHIVSSAAVLLNWFRAETRESDAMRPGIAPPDVATNGDGI